MISRRTDLNICHIYIHICIWMNIVAIVSGGFSLGVGGYARRISPQLRQQEQPVRFPGEEDEGLGK